MFNFSKVFFSKVRANKFIESLGCREVELWSGRDAFGQTIYTVKWN
jgi:hypothetical protein